MLREAVSSSNVVSVGYDPAHSLLEVEYKPDKAGVGTIYQYEPVEPAQYEEIRTAASVGRALLQIKADGGIICTKVGTIVNGVEYPFEAAS